MAYISYKAIIYEYNYTCLSSTDFKSDLQDFITENFIPCYDDHLNCLGYHRLEKGDSNE